VNASTRQLQAMRQPLQLPFTIDMYHKQIRAVVFDFDSTLAETHIDFGEMRRRIVEHLRNWGLWEDAYGEGRWVLELIELGAAKLADESARRQFLEEAEQHLQDVEIEGCADADLYPGTVAALARLRAQGIGIGIVTRNCRRCVTPVLEHHAAPHDVLMTREDVERVKPDPLHLLSALQVLGVEPGHALMVGDHPSDVECGVAAGAMTAGVLTGKSTQEQFEASGADVVCADVGEVVEWVMGGGDERNG